MSRQTIWQARKPLNRLSIAVFAGLLSAIANRAQACAGDGCSEWCGEPTSAYFLRPANDTRANLALILEDLQALSFSKADKIPIHYFSFADVHAEENAQADIGEYQARLNELAPGLGVKAESLNAALQRFRAVPEGRCVSNNPKTVLQFMQVLQGTTDIAAADKQQLIEERLRLFGLCEKAADTLPNLAMDSTDAQAFADYLQASALFYAGKFDELTRPPVPAKPESSWFERVINNIVEWLKRLFGLPHTETVKQRPPVTLASLSGSANPWVKETAIYLLGRVYLNQAQKDFQYYSEQRKADTALLAKAKTQFQAYLAAYPQGLYAESAQKLFRKIDWLAEDYAGLTQAYTLQLASWRQQTPSADKLLAFFSEVDSKYAYDRAAATMAWDSPILASVSVLKAMRYNIYEADKPKPIEAYFQSAWAAHKPGFVQTDLTALHEYLGVAYQFYVAHDYAAIEQLITDLKTTNAPSNVEFSTQVLRGLALGMRGKWGQTETLWLELLPKLQKTGQKIQLQWLLAMAWQQQNRLDKVYAADSPINQAEIEDFFIGYAPARILESQLGNPKLLPAIRVHAYNTLMEKLLLHRQYAEFQRIGKQYPANMFADGKGLSIRNFSAVALVAGYTCPSVDTIIAGLLKNPKNPALLNCYADALNGLYLPSSAYPGWDDPVANEHQLAAYFDNGQFKADANGDGFAGKAYSSLDLYMEVIDSSAKGEAKAYALSSATTCFATMGYNHCGIQDIPVERRAAWFRLLKTTYKDTVWAKEQKYYW